MRIYACGPTVYGRIHVGNARPFVVFSLLRRFLLSQGYGVDFVANVTDVNDKIYAAAQAQRVNSAELAREMTEAYVADTDALGLGRPDHEPLASETIGPIVGLIERLVEGGHAYAADGDVYFAVRSYPKYGELSHRDIDQMDQGEGVEGAQRKRDPLDFALWKAHKPDEDTFWEAPWGAGRPGWHIECSAMAEDLLGLEFEIHGGGSDLLFPHHENEAAQTAAARDRPLAQTWMHNGMVRLDSDKMSKSVGNVFVLHEALERHGRDALLMYFCQAHYRQPVEFDDERLHAADLACSRIREAARGLREGASPEFSAPLVERFYAALAADFSTPHALAAVFEWVREANRQPAATVGSDDLRAMLDVLGLANLLDPVQAPAPPADALDRLEERQRARAQRNFARADELRAELRELGWEVRDGPEGPELLPVK
ncbi:MAG: cysteinyl-tRNA synthetase [Solirubrobacteraceae bacterium]|nr:cysteinyl-tRNA synthetase [Solirubrobacteraceae bacterium]